ncbi:hypothetical protein PPACK8108_LOCUS12697 [Phakopsora pachyrhizi]|uniref:Uncharacterized protein n=1 Tax=Phakopsora pachyrhizi TaxID=170000 RepID=A0AAV0B5T0_PHAPC|nr:hypothetical protein PPACK8108_LOCUS12697 [Phakopsora pachyrhizi]
MWKRKVGSRTFDWASLVSIKHFQRLRGLIQDLRGHINTNEKITCADSLAYVKQLIELDKYWATGQEMSQFLNLYGKVKDIELSDFHNWLNKGNPLQAVATTSLGSYHDSDRLQAHLLAIRDWVQRAAFLSVIIKKGKKEVRAAITHKFWNKTDLI